MGHRAVLIACLVLSFGALGYRLSAENTRAMPGASTDLASGVAVSGDVSADAVPQLIFRSRTVRWADLAPGMTQANDAPVAPAVLGTFPVPHAYSGSPVNDIHWDEETVGFPAFGAYYLKTTLGNLKILLIDPALDEASQVVRIAAFVAGNTVHSLASRPRLRQESSYAFTPERLLPDLFASDQPLKLYCGGVSEFLGYVFHRQGYRPQLVQLVDERGQPVHVVMQVYIPSLTKFVMVDPDYGAVVLDRAGSLLSVGEFAQALRSGDHGLQIEDIAGGKKQLQLRYRQGPAVPDFAWEPRKSSTIGILDSSSYLRDMVGYTTQYWIHDWGGSDWRAPNRYHWDGRPVAAPAVTPGD